MAVHVCSTCLVRVHEVDGIWYHADEHGLAQHLARPSTNLLIGA